MMGRRMWMWNGVVDDTNMPYIIFLSIHSSIGRMAVIRIVWDIRAKWGKLVISSSDLSPVPHVYWIVIIPYVSLIDYYNHKPRQPKPTSWTSTSSLYKERGKKGRDLGGEEEKVCNEGRIWSLLTRLPLIRWHSLGQKEYGGEENSLNALFSHHGPVAKSSFEVDWL